MTQYSTYHFDILLANMLRHPAILQLASQNLMGTFFQQVGGTMAHALVFDTIKKYFEQYQRPPDEAVIVAEIEDTISRIITPGHPIIVDIRLGVQNFFQFRRLVDDASLPMVNELIAWMAQRCEIEPKTKEMLTQALEGSFFDGLGDRLKQLESQRRGLSSGDTTLGVGTTISRETGRRIRTGIDFVDNAIGKGAGMMSGSAAVLLAPQGCGKTTFGLQLVTRQALLGRHALLVLIEEGLSTTVIRNIRASTTGISTEIWEQANDDIVKACELARVSSDLVFGQLRLIDRHLHVLDMLQHPGGISKVVSEVDRMTLQGQRPEVVYIDWAGPLCQHMLSNVEDGGPDREEAVLRLIVDTAAVLAARTDNLVLISHQMAPAMVAKGAGYPYDCFCAAGCRGMTQSAKYCLVISPRDPRTNIQQLSFAKTRNDPPNQRVLVNLRGDIAQIHPAVGYERKGKQLLKVNTKPTLPTEVPVKT